MQQPDAKIAALIDLLKKLPPPEVKDLAEEFKPFFRCSGCNKMYHIREMRMVRSPYSYKHGNVLLDPICTECRKNTEDFTLIVDPSAQRVIARISPHTDPTGFKFKPKAILHVDVSPRSDGSKNEYLVEDPKEGDVLMTSILLEKKLFDQEHRKIITQ